MSVLAFCSVRLFPHEVLYIRLMESSLKLIYVAYGHCSTYWLWIKIASWNIANWSVSLLTSSIYLHNYIVCSLGMPNSKVWTTIKINLDLFGQRMGMMQSVAPNSCLHCLLFFIIAMGNRCCLSCGRGPLPDPRCPISRPLANARDVVIVTRSIDYSSGFAKIKPAPRPPKVCQWPDIAGFLSWKYHLRECIQHDHHIELF